MENKDREVFRNNLKEDADKIISWIKRDYSQFKFVEYHISEKVGESISPTNYRYTVDFEYTLRFRFEDYALYVHYDNEGAYNLLIENASTGLSKKEKCSSKNALYKTIKTLMEA